MTTEELIKALRANASYSALPAKEQINQPFWTGPDGLFALAADEIERLSSEPDRCPHGAPYTDDEDGMCNLCEPPDPHWCSWPEAPCDHGAVKDEGLMNNHD